MYYENNLDIAINEKKPLNKRSRFQKTSEKRTIKFGVHMRKKYQLQNLIPDQKEKDDSHICSSLQGQLQK